MDINELVETPVAELHFEVSGWLHDYVLDHTQPMETRIKALIKIGEMLGGDDKGNQVNESYVVNYCNAARHIPALYKKKHTYH